MLRYLIIFLSVLLSTLIGLSANVYSTTIDHYDITKIKTYEQTSAGTTLIDYIFAARVNGEDLTQVTVTDPDGDDLSLTEISDDQFLYHVEEIPTLEALDSLYPDGEYTFNINDGSDTRSVTLGGNFTEEIPLITSHVAGSIIDLTPTFQWNQWVPEYIDDVQDIDISIWKQTETSEEMVYGWEHLGYNAIQHTIPEGILGYDSHYLLTLSFYYATNFGTGSETGLDSFQVQTDFEFYTEPIPEPATMLLLGSGLIGLAGARRKFKK